MLGPSPFGERHAGKAGFWQLTYEHRGQLPQAQAAIDEAIEANAHIPDELPFRSEKHGHQSGNHAETREREGESDELYRRSAALIDVMLAHAPTQNVERIVLAEMGSVYSGYFASLLRTEKINSAFRTA